MAEIVFTGEDLRRIEEAISGVILFDETLRTKASDGTPFAQLLSKKGIMPGIKVDKGPVDIPNFPGEVVTEGLDGLRARLKEATDVLEEAGKARLIRSPAKSSASVAAAGESRRRLLVERRSQRRLRRRGRG
jgi:fructose-bisphosphate aldolase class I